MSARTRTPARTIRKESSLDGGQNGAQAQQQGQAAQQQQASQQEARQAAGTSDAGKPAGGPAGAPGAERCPGAGRGAWVFVKKMSESLGMPKKLPKGCPRMGPCVARGNKRLVAQKSRSDVK